MGLIDAEKLTKRFKQLKGVDSLANMFITDVVKEIQGQPTVEAIPVVYCKECKRWGCGLSMETDSVKCCGVGNYMVGKNGYCVYGEKKV